MSPVTRSKKLEEKHLNNNSTQSTLVKEQLLCKYLSHLWARDVKLDAPSIKALLRPLTELFLSASYHSTTRRWVGNIICLLLTALEDCGAVACMVANTYGSHLVKLSEDSDAFLAAISCNITRVLCDKSGSLQKLPPDIKSAKAQVECLSASRLHGWLENYQMKMLERNKGIPLTTQLFRGTRLEMKQDTVIAICRSFLAQLTEDQLTIMIPSVDYKFFHFIDIPRVNISQSGFTHLHNGSISGNKSISTHEGLYLNFQSESWTFLVDTEAMYSKEMKLCFSSTEQASLLHDELRKVQALGNESNKTPSLIIFDSTILDVSESLEDSSNDCQAIHTHALVQNGDPVNHVSSIHSSPMAAYDTGPLAKPETSFTPGMHIDNYQHDSTALRENNEGPVTTQAMEHSKRNEFAIYDIPLQDDDPVTLQDDPEPLKENGSYKQDRVHSPIRLRLENDKSTLARFSDVNKINSSRQSTSLNLINSPGRKSEMVDEALNAHLGQIRKALSVDRQKSRSLKAKMPDHYIVISSDVRSTPNSALICGDNEIKANDNEEVERFQYIKTPQHNLSDNNSYDYLNSGLLLQAKESSRSKKGLNNYPQLFNQLISVEKVHDEPSKSALKREYDISHGRSLQRSCKRRRENLRRSNRQPLVNVNDDGSPIPIQAPRKKHLDFSDDFATDVIKAAKLYDEPLRAVPTPNFSRSASKSSPLPLVDSHIRGREEHGPITCNPQFEPENNSSEYQQPQSEIAAQGNNNINSSISKQSREPRSQHQYDQNHLKIPIYQQQQQQQKLSTIMNDLTTTIASSLTTTTQSTLPHITKTYATTSTTALDELDRSQDEALEKFRNEIEMKLGLLGKIYEEMRGELDELGAGYTAGR